jgi:predicted nucleic acid-binding protein
MAFVTSVICAITGEVLDRVEAVNAIVTRNGGVAELVPPWRPLSARSWWPGREPAAGRSGRCARMSARCSTPPFSPSRDDRPGVLDTNVVILTRRLDPAALPGEPTITTVTLAELAVGPLTAADPAEAARRLEHLRFAEQTFDPLPFDAAAARAFGTVASALRQRQRKVAARSFDAMIAAIALANALPLYTTNGADFAGIDGLECTCVRLREERAWWAADVD